ncbi:hypothetical protein QQ045_032518 [Rhodiola kirilowii]
MFNQIMKRVIEGISPCFQSGVLRTNCIDCLDPTNVAQYAYGLASLGRQLHAFGLTDIPKVDPDLTAVSQQPAALMDMYQCMGDALAHQYGGSAAHNTVFTERQGKWKATTQSREFIKSIKRYYSNAYTDGEKQCLCRFLGYFKPKDRKPALWELDSDYYLHVSGIGDELFPEKFSQGEPKQLGICLSPIPACREDFLQMKLTSFDKLIERTCTSIKNVRLYCEPDQRSGGVAGTGSSAVAPDAALIAFCLCIEIQLKSPNWLFGQRKPEENGPDSKVASGDVNGARRPLTEKILDGFCDLNLLSSPENIDEEDIFSRAFSIELFEQDQEKHYAEVIHLGEVDSVDNESIEAAMEAALDEYNDIGADLGILPENCNYFAEDPSWLTRWIIGEEKV